ncbi:MAG: HAD hydrolase family protein [Candidatus Staskawiczbacteria bacterium]|nr:HAD hydrolase family protein [Candidatus Staskawiczbacteria bacterium]
MNKMLEKKFKKIKLLVLDFDGVMTDNKVLVSEDGKEAVFCNRSDGLGIGMLIKKGVEIIVISKEKNKVVQARCDKLEIKCLRGIDNKRDSFLREVKKRNLKLENVCFVGNDINDLECIKTAGIGVAVVDAYPEVLKAADYITSKKGGRGAIREVVDLILK